MKSAIAVFVKTPMLSPLKTRLAATIGENSAHEFYLHSIKAIEQTLQTINADIFWAIGEQKGLESPLWINFNRLHTGDGDLGQRQGHIYNKLLENYKQVILIGADAPQLSKKIFNQAFSMLQSSEFVFGPSNDGGYYMLGGKKPIDSTIWSTVPWSSEKTLEKFLTHFQTPPLQLKPMTDVDRFEDLANMIDEMPTIPNDKQRELIEWVTSILH